MKRVRIQVIPANGFPSGTYAPLKRRLEEHFSVGLTDYYREAPSLARCAAKVAADARKEAPEEKVVAFGHSLGGVLSMLASKEFDGVILYDAPMFSSFSRAVLAASQMSGFIHFWPTVRKWSKRPLGFASREDAEAYVRARSVYQKMHPEVLEAFLQCGFDENYQFRYSPALETQFFLETPTELIHKPLGLYDNAPPGIFYYSTHHEFIPSFDIAWLQRRFHPSLSFIPVDASHFAPLYDLDLTVNLIRDAVRDLDINP